MHFRFIESEQSLRGYNNRGLVSQQELSSYQQRSKYGEGYQLGLWAKSRSLGLIG